MHWQEVNSTTFKWELKIKPWTCNSHFKGQLCIIMYPFKTRYVHVLYELYVCRCICVYSRKKKSIDQTVFEGSVLLFLRSYPCRNIFEK